MKTVKIVLFFLILILKVPIYGQDNTVMPQRTPEQEAVKQTEKLQQELNLNSEQAKQIYEINLRYAHERLISNKRSEGLFRAKNKNAEIQQVLSSEQNERLQSKRFERTSIERRVINRNQLVNSSGFRSTSDFHTNQSNLNSRENNRPVNSNFQNKNQTNRPVRNTTPVYRSPHNQTNSNINRYSTGNSSNVPTRKSENSVRSTTSPYRLQGAPANGVKRESSIPQTNNATPRQQNTQPSTNQTQSPARRSDTPVNTNRK